MDLVPEDTLKELLCSIEQQWGGIDQVGREDEVGNGMNLSNRLVTNPQLKAFFCGPPDTALHKTTRKFLSNIIAFFKTNGFSIYMDLLQRFEVAPHNATQRRAEEFRVQARIAAVPLNRVTREYGRWVLEKYRIDEAIKLEKYRIDEAIKLEEYCIDETNKLNLEKMQMEMEQRDKESKYKTILAYHQLSHQTFLAHYQPYHQDALEEAKAPNRAMSALPVAPDVPTPALPGLPNNVPAPVVPTAPLAAPPPPNIPITAPHLATTRNARLVTKPRRLSSDGAQQMSGKKPPPPASPSPKLANEPRNHVAASAIATRDSSESVAEVEKSPPAFGGARQASNKEPPTPATPASNVAKPPLARNDIAPAAASATRNSSRAIELADSPSSNVGDLGSLDFSLTSSTIDDKENLPAVGLAPITQAHHQPPPDSPDDI